MLRLSSRLFGKALVVAELAGGKVLPATFAAITAAAKVGPVTALVSGTEGKAAAIVLANVKGVEEVLVSTSSHYDHGLPEECAPLVVTAAKKGNFTHVFAATSAFGKGLIPRAAVAMDSMPISEVVEIVDESTFVRQTYAGNAVVTVKSSDSVIFATIRGTSFERAPMEGGNGKTTDLEAGPVNGKAKWIEDLVTTSDTPDLTTAPVVISGGRGMKNGDNFQLLYDLAKPLNGAVGATRAVVDAGYVNSELQVGQTGKTVAPNLYIACGVSGAIQHVAGMKDSKVIAVINTDGDAPFFQISDYGLVQDLFEVVPQLTKMITKSK